MSVDFNVYNDGRLYFGIFDKEDYVQLEIVSDSYQQKFQLFFPFPFYYNHYLYIVLSSISPKSSQFSLALMPWFWVDLCSGFKLELRFHKYEFFTYLRWDLIRDEIPAQISEALRNGEKSKANRLTHVSQIMQNLEQAFHHTKALLQGK